MIHHVTHPIAPAQLEDCTRFYAILGFEPVPVPPGLAGRAVWLEHAVDGHATQIHLMPRPDTDAGGGSGHVAVICPEYARTIAELERAGHPVQPRPEYWGAPRAYVHDPAGNLVELMAAPPATSSN